jgi:tetratricopeptide (TPR) repeat protein
MIAAQFEAATGTPEAAEGHLRKAIEVAPANLDAYNALAGLYIRQRKLEEGKQELEQIVRRKPDAIGARTMIAIIQQTQGRIDDAIKTYDGIVRETGKAPVAANNLAYLYAERNDQLDQALALAQSAKQQLPENPDITDTLGWVYYKKGMADLAVRELEFSVQKNPENPVYLVHLGLIYAKAGKPEKARTTLSQALKLKADVEGAAEARAVLASLRN